jgi:hypothetical protein
LLVFKIKNITIQQIAIINQELLVLSIGTPCVIISKVAVAAIIMEKTSYSF